MNDNSFHIMQSEDGDWVGLYKDGVLLVEDHTLDVSDVLRALGIRFTFEERDLSDWGRCPETLA